MHESLDDLLFVQYNNCTLQQKAVFSNSAPVGAFRRDLRVLERELLLQLEGETACCGVTLAQCHALLELSISELSLSGLASAVDLDVSTLSRTVEGLVKARLVKRTQALADRRSVRLVLTTAGRTKVAAIDEMCNRYYTGLFEQLSEKDQRCIVRAVGVLAHAMRSRRLSTDQQSCCATPQVPSQRSQLTKPRKGGKVGSK